jgi:hypothetical protein
MGLATAASLTGCEGSTTQPEDEQEPDATALFPGLTVSDADGAGAGTALAAGTAGVTYVSACPGTFSDADDLTITNLANGKSKTVPLVGGGFDPVALEAEPGDELEILVHHNDGSTSRYLTRVPARKRPRVVRTVPPKDATDVVLSASILAVFSEPVDPSTVTAGNLRLLLEGEHVAGTIVLSDDGLRAEFTPTDPLQSARIHTLVITTSVRDLDGDPLEEEVQTTFTTEPSQEWATIELCAKQVVVEEVNQIQESDEAGWQGPEITSTEPSCGVTDAPYEPYKPRGTFRYRVEGRKFEWEFEGTGLIPPRKIQELWFWHDYALILYRDPWPGKGLLCLEESSGSSIPNSVGMVSKAGSVDLSADLVDAKIWVVESASLDCKGDGVDLPPNIQWANPDGVPRLTNDYDSDGIADATDTWIWWDDVIWCWPNCSWERDNAVRAYDWLFETALINYRDTDG